MSFRVVPGRRKDVQAHPFFGLSPTNDGRRPGPNLRRAQGWVPGGRLLAAVVAPLRIKMSEKECGCPFVSLPVYLVRDVSRLSWPVHFYIVA